MASDSVMYTDYEIMQPNYYLIYGNILYNCLPNITDIFTYFINMVCTDDDDILDRCERIQYSTFN